MTALFETPNATAPNAVASLFEPMAIPPLSDKLPLPIDIEYFPLAILALLNVIDLKRGLITGRRIIKSPFVSPSPESPLPELKYGRRV